MLVINEDRPHYRMSAEEEEFKDKLIYEILADNGYKTFAEHLINYDVFLTEDPTIAAAMVPSRGEILINRYFLENEDDDLLSVLIRHELLHFLLKHMQGAITELAEYHGLDPHHLKKSDYFKLRDEAFARKLIPGFEGYGPVSIQNVAGDYDLSRYYSKLDMDKQKTGLFNGSPIGGLVLELDHPEWLKLDYKGLLRKLREIEQDARRKALTEIQGAYNDDTDDFTPDPDSTDADIKDNDQSK